MQNAITKLHFWNFWNSLHSKLQCRICKEQFESKKQLYVHLRQCGTFQCKRCNVIFPTKDSLDAHQCERINKRTLPRGKRRKISKIRCRQCGLEFANRKDFNSHRVNVHIDRDHKFTFSEPFPWIINGQIDSDLRDVLVDNRASIFQPHSHDDVHSVYNFPLLDGGEWRDILIRRLEDVSETIDDAIKIDITLGYVIKDGNDYRFWSAGDNVPVLPTPRRIDRPGDWEELYSTLTLDYMTEHIKSNYPNTTSELKLVCHAIVDVSFLDATLGAGNVPDYIKNNNCIHALISDSHNKPYNDSACATRCLAFHRLWGQKGRQTCSSDGPERTHRWVYGGLGRGSQNRPTARVRNSLSSRRGHLHHGKWRVSRAILPDKNHVSRSVDYEQVWFASELCIQREGVH